MKKILVVLLVILGFGQVYAEDKLYYTVVTVNVEYYYHKRGHGEVGHYSGLNEYQAIEVCASSPDDAREKAKDQCSSMCHGDQKMGNGIWDGESLPKYKRRRVYEVKINSVGGDC